MRSSVFQFFRKKHPLPSDIQMETLSLSKTNENGVLSTDGIGPSLPSPVLLLEVEDNISTSENAEDTETAKSFPNIDELLDEPQKSAWYINIITKYKNATYGISTINAIEDGADMAMSLNKTGTNNPLILVSTVGIKMAVSMGLNGGAVKESTDEIADLMINGLPQNWEEESPRKQEMLKKWPALTPANENIARTAVVLPILYTVGIDIIAAKFFIEALPREYKILSVIPAPGWTGLSIVVGAAAGITSGLTKGTEAYDKFRKFFRIKESAKNWDRYTIVSIVVGGGLGLVDAAEEVAKSYMTAKSVFNLNHSIGLLAVNLMEGPMNMCFSGMVMVDGLHDFCKYLPQIPEEKPAVLIQNGTVLAISFLMAFYISFFMRPLAEASYNQDLADFNDDSEAARQAAFFFSIVNLLQETLLGTICLYKYNPLHALIPYVLKRFGFGSDGKFDDIEFDDLETQAFLSGENCDDNNYPTPQVDKSMEILAEGLKKHLAELEVESNKAAIKESRVEVIVEDAPPQSSQCSNPSLIPLLKETECDSSSQNNSNELTNCHQTFFAVPAANPEEERKHAQTTRQLKEENLYSRRFMAATQN